MIEAFLRQAGIRFRRDFALTPEGVRGELRDNLGVSFAENRIFLPLEDVRPTINYLPLPKGSPAKAVTSKPIMAVLPCPPGPEWGALHPLRQPHHHPDQAGLARSGSEPGRRARHCGRT